MNTAFVNILIIFLCVNSLGCSTDKSLQNTPLQTIQVTPENLQMEVGDNVQLKAEPGPADTDSQEMPFSWGSSNRDVADVTAYGLVIARSAGKAEITARGRVSSQISKSVPVTVTEKSVPLTSISVRPENLELKANEFSRVIAIPNPVNATDVAFVWESDDTGIATVDALGIVTGIAEGNTAVTVKSGDIEASLPVVIYDLDTIRVLAVGNSFSDDALEDYLYDMGQAKGVTFIIGNLYQSGFSLQQHWGDVVQNRSNYNYRKTDSSGKKTRRANTSLQYGVKDEEWDYISFQQRSADSGLLDTFSPYLSQLTNYVREHATNPNAEFVFHQTWAYDQDSKLMAFTWYGSNQIQMYEAIVNASKTGAEAVGITKIIPSGTAIQNGRGTFIGDNFSRDGSHLSLGLGRYTAAATWFESLSGKSIIGNPVRPVENNVKASELETLTIQHAAHQAVAAPFEVTEINVH